MGLFDRFKRKQSTDLIKNAMLEAGVAPAETEELNSIFSVDVKNEDTTFWVSLDTQAIVYTKAYDEESEGRFFRSKTEVLPRFIGGQVKAFLLQNKSDVENCNINSLDEKFKDFSKNYQGSRIVKSIKSINVLDVRSVAQKDLER